MSARLLQVAALALCLAVPLVPGLPSFWITLLNYIGLYAMVTLGLVVLTGVGGMTSFGQAMFVGFGAYTTAIATTRYGLSPWLTLPLAMLTTGFCAWIIGVVTLRLSGHYLPLGTIAWNVALFFIFGNLDFFARYDGISGIPPLTIGSIVFSDGASMYYLIWLTLAVMIIATQNLLASRVGRAIRALRGGVIAAEAFGVDTARAKMLAFIYAALLAAVSGWLYAHLQRAVNPTPFNLSASIEYLLMAVVGGAGSVWGAILGAGLVTVVRDQLQDILPRLLGAQGNFETIAFGIILVAILQTAREGLWPHIAQLASWVKPAGRSHAAAGALAPCGRPEPQAAAPLLEVVGLRKVFGGLVAVNDVSFAVDRGEIVGLIGPNGAGKSTTFDLITGISPPTAGEIRFGGEAIAGERSRAVARRGIARTFQHVRLVPSMSVIENVALGAHLRGRAGALAGITRLDQAEERRIFAEAARQLGRVGLGEMADRPATSLALGQQRIVEIARALCLDPVLLLLDEPAAGLRHREKAELAELLRRLKGEGLSILLVEHDMDFVMGLTDRLVVMEFGTKLAEGDPATVRANPAVIDAYLGGVT
ncbi:branched-chain amino acid ABC transporter ATP-binding protein/permease [Chelatococcus reniformis]|uniref:Branched-chain amino acid ABC transporter n=1 Tax=Chelatococcus reniformis TaxID=1494448 RepID=A0A916XFG0_9HYPH|nr:branched-chain amino acid ABC transporter ATP-binding protein/permease [Chelatococcus reniformis]GGC67969.1 branched-chain amino acid ABC transporter [Chelatococcus reniformis]